MNQGTKASLSLNSTLQKLKRVMHTVDVCIYVVMHTVDVCIYVVMHTVDVCIAT
jgi:hypothetical protein